MEIVEPTVHFAADTRISWDHLDTYFDTIEAPEFYARMLETGEDSGQALSEIGGKLCYKSFKAGLNPNVTKVRDDRKSYIGNILKSKHGSVLEHSSVTFIFQNVSRVVTHEIVRHRAGMAFSQESLRFVRLTELKGYYPEAFGEYVINQLYEELVEAGMMSGNTVLMDEWVKDKVEMLRSEFEYTFAHLEGVQRKLADSLLLEHTKSFGVKKKITSAMRRLAPIGLATNIMVTGNHRAWRNIIAQRTSPHAEEEIRCVISQVASFMDVVYPDIYQDMSKEHLSGSRWPVWTLENDKI